MSICIAVVCHALLTYAGHDVFVHCAVSTKRNERSCVDRA